MIVRRHSYAGPLWTWICYLANAQLNTAYCLLRIIVGQLRVWVVSNGASLASDAYGLVSRLPFVQFLTLGSQWGDVLKPPYAMFGIEKYWGAPNLA